MPNNSPKEVHAMKDCHLRIQARGRKKCSSMGPVFLSNCTLEKIKLLWKWVMWKIKGLLSFNTSARTLNLIETGNPIAVTPLHWAQASHSIYWFLPHNSAKLDCHYQSQVCMQLVLVTRELWRSLQQDASEGRCLWKCLHLKRESWKS